MTDELTQFLQKCLLRELDRFIKPSLCPLTFLLVNLRIKFSQVVRGLDGGKIVTDMEESPQRRWIVSWTEQAPQSLPSRRLEIGIVFVQSPDRFFQLGLDALHALI